MSSSMLSGVLLKQTNRAPWMGVIAHEPPTIAQPTAHNAITTITRICMCRLHACLRCSVIREGTRLYGRTQTLQHRGSLQLQRKISEQGHRRRTECVWCEVKIGNRVLKGEQGRRRIVRGPPGPLDARKTADVRREPRGRVGVQVRDKVDWRRDRTHPGELAARNKNKGWRGNAPRESMPI